jgi:non-specific serine/threonine protein kinase/serine/threonine-protein kinase
MSGPYRDSDRDPVPGLAAEAENRWQQIETLFHRAIELPFEQREAAVRSWCPGNNELIQEVLSLAHSADDLAELQTQAQPEPADPWLDRTLGRYRVVAFIGRGGMGAVYKALRPGIEGPDGGEVAVKVIASRLYSPFLQERFLDERRALAALTHPHICRIFDGGVTPEGEAYCVMEYIRGARLDEFCRGQGVTRDRLLQLFSDLCEAVAFAHRNMILHGDLKPSNVMVAAEGEIKLLDFGTAKLLSAANQDGSRDSELLAVTPGYASPEALRGDRCTTAADVYSLGAILCRLLTGEIPSPATGSPTISPHLPSSLDSIAAPHGKSVAHASIPADLEAIVLKAIDSDPSARYATAAALARDVQRFRAQRPVEASGNGWPYRARKFAARNRLALTAGAVVLCALGAGFAAVVHETRLAMTQEQRARREIVQVRQLANFLVNDLYDQVALMAASTGAQRKLAAEASAYLDAMAPDAAGDFPLEMDMANAYARLGGVLGSPEQDNLGDTAGAIAAVTKAVDITQDALKLRPPDPEALRHASRALRMLSEIEFGDGRAQIALQHASNGAELNEGLLQLGPSPDAADLREATRLQVLIGDEYGLQGGESIGDVGAAIAAYRRGLPFAEVLLKRDPHDLQALRAAANVHIKIANLQREAQPAVARQGYQSALNLLLQIASPPPVVERQKAIVYQNLARCLFYEEKPRDSLKMYSQAWQIMSEAVRQDPQNMRTQQNLASLLNDFGQANEKLKDWPAARANYAHLVAVLASALARNKDNHVWREHYAQALIELAGADYHLGDRSLAEQEERRGVAESVHIAELPDASADDKDGAAANLLNAQLRGLRNPARALQFSTRAVEMEKGSDPEVVITLAQAQAACGQTEAARATVKRVLSVPVSNDVRRMADRLLTKLPPEPR